MEEVHRVSEGMESRRRVKRKKKRLRKGRLVFVLFMFIIIVYFIVTSYIYFKVKKYSSLIYPEISVENVDVGGKTKEEAIKLLNKTFDAENIKSNITIKVNNNDYVINLSKLDLKYDIQNVVDKAFEINRGTTIFQRYRAIKHSKNSYLKLNIQYSSDVINNTIADIEKKNNKKPIDAAISRSNTGSFNVIKEISGLALDKDNLKNAIISNIKLPFKDNTIINGKMNEIKAKVTEENLKAIDAKISTFTTNFATSNYNRSTNINLAANAINGKVLMPGEEFSFNDVVGKRTPSKGYKEAHVIVGDKFIDDFGGGVCQVSTTLYNAVARANIPSTERAKHTIPSSYVGLGMDATVDYGNLDYKFKNTLKYPIYIEAVVKNKEITFNIYSNSELTKRNYDLVNEIIGKKVNVYRVTYENNKQISKDLLYTDSYK
ncbi:VanW family protein [Clostridium omnivorum]|uniref:Exported protein n=1 Tax=Clostridium omnivorum TaxID=1604902 RepID=A0ABQ5N2Q6_9CLOT|nr:VanW family protein [Clostridium sp. E14]GLC29497.1 exported protein [Clostridium sp. E14]